MWLGLLARFWPILAGAMALIGAALWVNHAGYKSGYAASEAHWQPLFSAAAIARDEANARAALLEAASTAQTRELEKQYAEALSSLTLRSAGANRRIHDLSMRIAAASACREPVSGVAGSVTGDADAAERESRATAAGDSITGTGTDCEADAARVEFWTNWYREQRAIRLQ
jgi:hypothetical protein